MRSTASIAAKQDKVRGQIHLMILSGVLRPGERINEQALAMQLSVGRNATREALRSLEQLGLVRIIPNKGAEVRRVNLEEALELYDIRTSLSRTAGVLLARRMTPEMSLKLQMLRGQMTQALDTRDGQTYQTLNAKFHRLLVHGSMNSRLIELSTAIEDQLALFLGKGMFSVAQMQASDHEHGQIVAALASGDATLAGQLLEEHVEHGKQRMLDTVARLGRNP